DVLELRSLDSGSNFFEAGGDSVSAAQVIARASRELGKEIPLHLLFDNPTVARFATALASIDAGLDKKPVLRRLGLKEAALSLSQQRLWIDEQLRAGQTVYNISMGLSMSGDLDVPALQSSLNEIVRRHESLRTRFISDDGEPRQVIVPHLRLDVSLLDLSSPEQEDVAARLRELLRAEAAKPFNLEETPLVRATLVRLGARSHVLVLIAHHMVCDGWSAAVMLRELSKLYAALAQGRPSPLEELPVQYADFAVWQRELLQGEVLEALLGYWRKQLAGVPYHLQLPADHPRPVVNLHRGARSPLHLNAELSQRLAALGRQEDATLFMTLAALFQILLARYSGQQEFLLGCPVANRSEVETQGLIGFLVNTVVLHCDLREDPAFRPLLRRVREKVLEAHKHQDLPFEKLVEELQPEREPGSTPLFQVMLLLRQAEPVIEVEGLRLEPLKVETDVAMYDLTLELTETAEGLRGGFEYNVDLFDAATIERFADQFLKVGLAVFE
ncbi:MAG TPA: condensation domain-containing protein, partial [Chloroflexia bacterium]|nr:condensation domain-containing protein [Chloroflexia bacterium]